jgi:ribosomal protein S18 acetylase RimI-like enzyme
MGDVTIKRVAASDAGLFNRIAVDVFDEPIVPARLAAYLATPGHLMIVAIKDDEVVGQTAAVVHRHPDKASELYIDEVGVTPALHRQGIARRMLAEMLVWGKELGCGESWVGTETDNVPARGLYEGFGAHAQLFVMYEMDL